MTIDARAARHWAGTASAYADTFAHYCAGTIPALLDRAAAGGTGDVLEVGSGTGLLATRLIEVGSRLTATEPDPDMVAIARDALPDTTDLVRAGLPRLPFPTARFDCVIANFVINHVGDPRAAVAELTRVARPGGRVLFTVWPSGPTAQAELFAGVLSDAGVTIPPSDTLPPHLDFERSARGVVALCDDAGLDDASVTEVAISWRIHPDDFWRGLEAGIGVLGRTLRAQPDEVRARLRASYDDLGRALLDGDELVFPATALLAEGVKE